MQVRGRLAAGGAALLAGVVALGGCTSPSPAERDAGAPRVELGFTQLLPDEGTRRGLLRVENVADSPLAVTAAGLRWSGYGGEFTSPQDATIAPHATLDLRVRLPVADCDAGDGPVVGVVETAGAETVQELTASGQVFVRRLWGSWCGDRLLADNIHVVYGDDWRLDPRGASEEPAAVGTLVVHRVGGSDPMTVRSVDGSVLYDVDLDTPAVLDPARATVRLPMAVLPGNRCDEHARGQATAPWTFGLTLRVEHDGEQRPARLLVPPPLAVQQLAERALDRACVLRAR